jgi:hypothetical protein
MSNLFFLISSVLNPKYLVRMLPNKIGTTKSILSLVSPRLKTGLEPTT